MLAKGTNSVNGKGVPFAHFGKRTRHGETPNALFFVGSRIRVLNYSQLLELRQVLVVKSGTESALFRTRPLVL
jgi:hypothetical protein